jgi:SAM-dependent methyltransferase
MNEWMNVRSHVGINVADPYEHLGRGYAAHRRPDPRIAHAVAQALGDARTVVNIGAGAGSYEPAGRTVLAVEPSWTMLAQRQVGAAPAVRASAESLPLSDRSADAAMAVLTVHHWSDPAAGIAEMVRVSRRQVVLTWDPGWLASSFWLITDYLPEIARNEAGLACVETVVAEFRRRHRRVEVIAVPIPADCTDGVLGAYWRRPYAYLDAAVRQAMSGLALLSADVVEPALQRLREDLDSGAWHTRHADLLDLAERDLGYRLVVAAPA